MTGSGEGGRATPTSFSARLSGCLSCSLGHGVHDASPATSSAGRGRCRAPPPPRIHRPPVSPRRHRRAKDAHLDAEPRWTLGPLDRRRLAQGDECPPPSLPLPPLAPQVAPPTRMLTLTCEPCRTTMQSQRCSGSSQESSPRQSATSSTSADPRSAGCASSQVRPSLPHASCCVLEAHELTRTLMHHRRPDPRDPSVEPAQLPPPRRPPHDDPLHDAALRPGRPRLDRGAGAPARPHPAREGRPQPRV